MDEFGRTLQCVRRYLPPYLDPENTAADIMFECWRKGYERPSRTFIRHRCYDLLRKRTKEIKHRRPTLEEHEPCDVEERRSEERRDVVDQLVRSLTLKEKKVIFLRFYQNLTMREVAHQLSLTTGRVHQILTGALYHMREEADRERIRLRFVRNDQTLSEGHDGS